jgi:hypothetical protein
MDRESRWHLESRGKKLLGALLLAVGSVCLVFLAVSLARDLSLWVFGRNVSATVIDSWLERTSAPDAAEYTFCYFVTYQFEASNGKSYVNSSTVAPIEWSGFVPVAGASTGIDGLGNGPAGSADPVHQERQLVPQELIDGAGDASHIKVVYFTLFPLHNRLDESRFVPILACTYVPFIAIGWVAFAIGRQLLRQGSLV